VRCSAQRAFTVLLVLPLLVIGCTTDDTDRAVDTTRALNASRAASASELPLLGTQIPPLPPGGLPRRSDEAPARRREGREVAQTHCLACHASEMILQQQLTETQWRSEVDKMERWGADVSDDDKDALVDYLVSRFGPDNDRFTPIVASPQQRPDAGPNGGAQ
jgi:mono/diheme cytochrome c family protein